MPTPDQIISIVGSLLPEIIAYFKSRGVDVKGITADEIQKQVIEPHADKIVADIDAWKREHPISPEHP